MKKTIRLLFCSAICSNLILVATSNASAQDQDQRWYVKGDLGGNVTLDASLKEFFGEVAPGSKVKFDPGVRVGVAAGYFFTDWFAAEGEIGVLANNISSITDADRLDATYSQAPFLLNAKFQCPYDHFVKPYFGGGVGGSVATLDADHIDLNGTHFSGWMSDVVFAYQAFGGLRFKINDSMGVSVEYRYLATESPSWKADVTIGTDTDRVRFGGTQSHAVSIAFDWRF